MCLSGDSLIMSVLTYLLTYLMHSIYFYFITLMTFCNVLKRYDIELRQYSDEIKLTILRRSNHCALGHETSRGSYACHIAET